MFYLKIKRKPHFINMKVNTFTLIKSGFACITSDNPQYSYHLSHFIFLTCLYFISILYKSLCVFLKLRSFLDNKCIITFFLQFIFQSYCFIKRIIFPDLNCIIRILINDIPLVSICNRTIQNILCIRKITV